MFRIRIRLIFAIICGASATLRADLPIEEAWRIEFEVTTTCIGSTCSDEENVMYFLVGAANPAYIIPQDIAGSEKIEQFVVSVDSIESVTNIDFFWELEDVLKDSLEARIILGNNNKKYF